MDPEQERELQALVDQAELELASGESANALRSADRALAVLAEAPVPELLRAARFVRAGALEARGDLSGAIDTLTELTAEPFPDTAWITALIALSRCHRETGNPDAAIAVGRSSEPTIDAFGMVRTTEAIQLTVTVAMAYIFRGDLAQGRRLCLQAIRCAEENDLPIARASAYWNASIVETSKGRQEAALDLARLALAEFECADDGRNLGRLRMYVADLYLRIDPPDTKTSLTMLDLVERELAWSAASGVDIARQYMARFTAHMLDGNYDLAHEFLRKTSELVPDDALVIRGWLLVSRGRLAVAEDDLNAARAAYHEAVQVLSATGSDRDVAQVWFELGGVLSGAREHEAAREAYRRAAISNGVSARPSRLRRPAVG